MAIYHCNISNVSRASGSTSCASLSYIESEKVKDDRLGKTFYYSGEDRVIHKELFLPEEHPERFEDEKVLFNELELYDRGERVRTAKKIKTALPYELSDEEQREVVKDYAKRLTDKGYGVFVAIHREPDGHNPHCHFLVTNRPIDREGFAKIKTKKEYALDENGERIPLIDKETGKQKVDKRNRKQWKRVDVLVNPLDTKQFLEELREGWAIDCNKHLEAEEQISHLSYKARGIEKIPTKHEGRVAREIEKKGGTSELCEYNREVRSINQALAKVQEQIKKIAEKIEELKTKVVEKVQALPVMGLRDWAESIKADREEDIDDLAELGIEPLEVDFYAVWPEGLDKDYWEGYLWEYSYYELRNAREDTSSQSIQKLIDLKKEHAVKVWNSPVWQNNEHALITQLFDLDYDIPKLPSFKDFVEKNRQEESPSVTLSRPRKLDHIR